jgi:hypothetical protein
VLTYQHWACLTLPLTNNYLSVSLSRVCAPTLPLTNILLLLHCTVQGAAASNKQRQGNRNSEHSGSLSKLIKMAGPSCFYFFIFVAKLMPSAFSLQPSSFSLHPSSFILHPSSFSLQPSAFSLQLYNVLSIPNQNNINISEAGTPVWCWIKHRQLWNLVY